MSNSLIPYSFTPGTKAKAQEVNANFIALANKIEENNSTALHQNSSATISAQMTYTEPIYSTCKVSDTRGNFVITNLADGDVTDVILAKNEDEIRCAAVRIENKDGYNEASIHVANEDGTETSSLGIRNTNGVSYGFAPTYTSDYADSSDKIVTTEYLANHWATTAPTTEGTASKTRPAVIIENYLNGTSGYRVWSDGLIEQWGIHVVNTKNGAGATITLMKSYKDTSFSTMICSRNTGTNWGFTIPKNNPSANQIKYYTAGKEPSDVTNGVFWHTFGY